ncbi:MAG: hypothetical protein ACYDEI_00315 [Erysipelotrichaceae bacterium]
MSKLNSEFIRGVAWAASFIINIYKETSLAEIMIKESGFTRKDFKLAKIDKFDWQFLDRINIPEGENTTCETCVYTADPHRKPCSECSPTDSKWKKPSQTLR